ncbi:energy transducer TonB [Amantichitinum ursilacus]|uniref:TonB C-terminal domain-containing protein n=1 Tax=Amantichitinum ursilacus TaxID=857265 RepID=A0A0N1JTG2_9NEIS|nr:energy transducer TonB [Amantichitinum ursilacus]KPC55154.1 hypothetical protein WG78_00805 [Amantichitinum ursilacus]
MSPLPEDEEASRSLFNLALVFALVFHLALLLIKFPDKGGSPPPVELQVQLQPKARAPAPQEPAPIVPEKTVQTQARSTYETPAPIKKPRRPVASAPRKQPRPARPQPPSPQASADNTPDVVIGGLDDAFARRQPNTATKAPPHLAMHLSDLPAQQAQSSDEQAATNAAERIAGDPLSSNLFGLWEHDVRAKVERMGDMNFPKDKYDRPIFGIIKFHLVVNYDGTIADVAITETSGNPELDAKALGILKMSVPLPRPAPALLDKRGHITLDRYYQFLDERVHWRR